jgi:hypothetical protein
MKTTTKIHHKIDLIFFSMGRSNKTHAFHFNPYMDGYMHIKKGNFYICGDRRDKATYYNRFLFNIIVNPT